MDSDTRVLVKGMDCARDLSSSIPSTTYEQGHLACGICPWSHAVFNTCKWRHKICCCGTYLNLLRQKIRHVEVPVRSPRLGQLRSIKALCGYSRSYILVTRAVPGQRHCGRLRHTTKATHARPGCELPKSSMLLWGLCRSQGLGD